VREKVRITKQMRRTLCLEGALVDGGASPVVEGELGHAAELELELAGREEHEVLHRYDVVEALEKCREALPADIHGALLEAEPEELIDVAAGDGNTGAARFQFASTSSPRTSCWTEKVRARCSTSSRGMPLRTSRLRQRS